jgi:hypothetical protein
MHGGLESGTFELLKISTDKFTPWRPGRAAAPPPPPL